MLPKCNFAFYMGFQAEIHIPSKVNYVALCSFAGSAQLQSCMGAVGLFHYIYAQAIPGLQEV